MFAIARGKRRSDDKKDKKDGAGFQRRQRRRYCFFCKEKIDHIDYKDVSTLRRFLSERNKIRPRRVTGNCVQHQAEVSKAIKNAREVALLPYPRK